MGSENNHTWYPKETCAMPNWNNNNAIDLEDTSAAVLELARDLPDALIFGAIQALISPVYIPAYVMAHARRGLRDFRAELKRWKNTPKNEQEPKP